MKLATRKTVRRVSTLCTLALACGGTRRAWGEMLTTRPAAAPATRPAGASPAKPADDLPDDPGDPAYVKSADDTSGTPGKAGALGKPAGAAGEPGGDLTKLSIEDLMNVEVYSAAKHSQKASETAAAISVLSQEDIRRSNMTSIPEMLRMVPGLDVAQINANQWAVTSRGFNDLYSNKLLVMMDGRSLYTPLFSGVYWDTVDYVIPDLDRIEVVRGPGATLWGANAVDGVINIVTKSARDTQGLLVEGVGGNYQQQGSIRYGGKIDDDTYYRVYTKFRNFDNFDAVGGGQAHDGWQDVRGGFRIDRAVGPDQKLTLQGDVYNERVGQTVNFPSFAPPYVAPRGTENNYDGVNLLARWTNQISSTSDVSIQAYYDRIDRGDVELGYSLDTFDLDFQHRFELAPRNEFIYGGDVRFLRDNIHNSVVAQFDPARRDDYLLSAFLQDDATIVPDRLHLIVGTKLEQNSYSGFEYEPSVRVLYTPNEQNTLWGAVSRAVRTPSRWEQDSRILFQTIPTPQGIPAQIDTVGNPSFTSEKLLSLETGYRVKPTQTLSFDFTGFFNYYDRVRSGVNGAPVFSPVPAPHVVVPVALNNGIFGETFGAEVAGTWQVTPIWRLTASYSWLEVQLHHHTGVSPTLETIFEGTSPRNQAQVHSYLDLTKNLELNVSAYYVDVLDTGHIPAYTRFDAGLTWKPVDNLAVSLTVQNLFSNNHTEFNSGLFLTQPTRIPRSYYASVDYRF